MVLSGLRCAHHEALESGFILDMLLSWYDDHYAGIIPPPYIQPGKSDTWESTSAGRLQNDVLFRELIDL